MTSPLQAPDTSRLRLSIIGVIVISLFGALFARLWFLQVMDGEELATKVVHNATRTVFEPAPRGRILDRNGKVLVENRESFVVTARAGWRPRRTRPSSTSWPPSSAGRWASCDRASPTPATARYKPVPLFEDVPIDRIVYIKEHTEDFPPDQVGADRRPSGPTRRSTPTARCWPPQVLGYVGEINDEELKARKDQGYLPGDEIGKTGVEQALRERAAGEARSHDRGSRPQGRRAAHPRARGPRPGPRPLPHPRRRPAEDGRGVAGPRPGNGEEHLRQDRQRQALREPGRRRRSSSIPTTGRCWRWHPTPATTPASS